VFIKSKRMRWAVHVPLVGEWLACTGFWWRNRRGRYQCVDPRINGKMIIKQVVRMWDVWGMDWIELLMIRTVGEHL